MPTGRSGLCDKTHSVSLMDTFMLKSVQCTTYIQITQYRAVSFSSLISNHKDQLLHNNGPPTYQGITLEQSSYLKTRARPEATVPQLPDTSLPAANTNVCVPVKSFSNCSSKLFERNPGKAWLQSVPVKPLSQTQPVDEQEDRG